MQNRVTIRGESPRIVEEARAQQLLNRQQLNNRILKDRIKKETSRRYDVAVRKGLGTGIKEGGQLEFVGRRAKKIRVARRASERGFLLLPSSGFDAEGKIFVRSAYGINPFATAKTATQGLPSSTNPRLTFTFVNNRLEPGSHPYLADLPGNSGNAAQGRLEYEMANSYDSAAQFTLECFLYLQGGGEIPGTIESLGDDVYRLTSYNSYLSLVMTSAQGSVAHSASFINKNKDFPITPVPGVTNASSLLGISQYWKLSPLNNLSQGVDFLVGTGTYHFAVAAGNGQIKEYFDGQLIRTQSLNAVSGVVPLEFDLAFYSYRQQSHVKKVPGSPQGDQIGDTVYSLIPLGMGISSIRFTPGVELYSGTSFTPPTSITDLA